MRGGRRPGDLGTRNHSPGAPQAPSQEPAQGSPASARASRAVAHGLDQGALRKLAEDAPQGVQFAAQLFHPLAQAVIVTGQLQHLLLRLHVALLGLVAALAHRDVVAFPPHPVLVAVLVHRLLGLTRAAAAARAGIGVPSRQPLERAAWTRQARSAERGGRVWAGHGRRRWRGVAGLQVHGGLAAVRDLELQVRGGQVRGGRVRVRRRRRRRRLVGEEAGQRQLLRFVLLPGLLLDHQRPQRRRPDALVQRLQSAVQVAGRRAAVAGGRAVRAPGHDGAAGAHGGAWVVKVAAAARRGRGRSRGRLGLLLLPAVLEQVGQELVVEGGRVDVGADVDGRLVFADAAQGLRGGRWGWGLRGARAPGKAEGGAAGRVRGALEVTAHQGPRLRLVEVGRLHGGARVLPAWRASAASSLRGAPLPPPLAPCTEHSGSSRGQATLRELQPPPRLRA